MKRIYVYLRSWQSQWIIAGGTSVLVLISYLFTLAPTVYTYDSAEISAAAYDLGIMHSPGYPVHLLLLHLFQKLVPLGDIGYRSNLFTALAGSLSAGLVAVFVTHLTQRRIIGIITALIYGWSFYTWSVAVIAEVYTLQTLFLLGLLWMLWRWQHTLDARWLFGAAFLGGIALANTLVSALWGLGLLWLALYPLRNHAHPWRTFGGSVGLLICGLLPLLYGPIRSSQNPEFINIGVYQPDGSLALPDLTSWDGFWWYISGQQFGNLFLDYQQQSFLVELGNFLTWLWAAFFGAGLPLGLLGIWQLWKNQRVLLIGSLLIIIPHSIFFISYNVLDKSTMFLPVFAIWALFIGTGIDLLVQWWPRLPLAIVAIWPVALLILNWSYCDVHDQWRYRNIARARLLQADQDSMYIARWGDAELMRYMQVVHNLRSDVQVINAFFAPPTTLDALVSTALDQQRSVYSAQQEPLLARYFFVADRFGYRVADPNTEGRTE